MVELTASASDADSAIATTTRTRTVIATATDTDTATATATTTGGVGYGQESYGDNYGSTDAIALFASATDTDSASASISREQFLTAVGSDTDSARATAPAGVGYSNKPYGDDYGSPSDQPLSASAADAESASAHADVGIGTSEYGGGEFGDGFYGGVEPEEVPSPIGRLGNPKAGIPVTAGGPLPGTAGLPLPGTAGRPYPKIAGKVADIGTAGAPLPMTAGAPLPGTAGTPAPAPEPARVADEYVITLVKDNERLVLRDILSQQTARRRQAIGTLTASVHYQDEHLSEWQFANVFLTYDERLLFQGELREVDPSPSSGETTLTVYGPGFHLDSGDISVTFEGTIYSLAIEWFVNEWVDLPWIVTPRRDSLSIDEQEFEGTPLEILDELHDRSNMNWYIDVEEQQGYSFPRQRSIRSPSIQAISDGHDPSWDASEYFNHVVVVGAKNPATGVRYRGEARDEIEIEEKGHVGPYPIFNPDLESDIDCQSVAEAQLEEFLAADERSGSIEAVPRRVDPGTALVIDEWDDNRQVGPYSLWFDARQETHVSFPGDPFQKAAERGTLAFWARADWLETAAPIIGSQVTSGGGWGEGEWGSGLWGSGTTADTGDITDPFRIADPFRLSLVFETESSIARAHAYPDELPPDETWTLLHYDWNYNTNTNTTMIRAGHDGQITSHTTLIGKPTMPDTVYYARHRDTYYSGYLDDVRLYTRRLSEAEYADLAAREIVPSQGIVFRTRFDEGPAGATAGDPVHDIVGGFHGTRHGPVEYRGSPFPVGRVTYSESSGEYSMSIDLGGSTSAAEQIVDAQRDIRSLRKNQ